MKRTIKPSLCLIIWLTLMKISQCCLELKQPDGVILITCPPGTYTDWNTCQCLPCHPYCSTCNGKHLSNCLTCKPDDSAFFGYSLVTVTGRRCHGCPSISQYREILTGTCHDCHSSCLTCFGFGQFKCRTCPGNVQSINGLCGVSPKTSCDLKEGYYFDSVGKELGEPAPDLETDYSGFIGCKKCHSSCKTCDNGTSFACKSCYSGSFLYNRRC
jgi:hypothetical protein